MEFKGIKSCANEISVNISKAIGVVSPMRTPINVVILENYVKALKEHPTFCQEAYDLVGLVLKEEKHEFINGDPMYEEVLKNPNLFEEAQRFVVKPEDLKNE